MKKPNNFDNENEYLNNLEDIQNLRRFDGDLSHFWSSYVDILVSISMTEKGLAAFKNSRQQGSWGILATSPRSFQSQSEAASLTEEIDSIARECFREGATFWKHNGSEYIAVALNAGTGGDDCLAVFPLKNGRKGQIRERIRRLQLVADVPASYRLQRVALESKLQVEHFANVFDLMVLINAEDRFLSSAMTLCNELASRHRCERVSIGWLDKGYVRIQAMSHVDHFDKKTEAVQLLEAAMEEALDQNTEIVVPPASSDRAIDRDHHHFIKSNDVANICSLPLRVEEEPVAVCTCERNADSFSEVEMRLLRLSCDQAARRLSDLKRRDRWFGARLISGFRDKLGKFLGFEHTWLKVAGIVIAGLLAYIIFGTAPYRIKSPVILRTDDVAFLNAPFDGHIEKVHVRVGDSVTEGLELMSFDQNNLLLREAELTAEMNRYKSELEKARAAFSTADMRIAQALLEQSAARLDMVRYQFGQSIIYAPFDGVIVEGDLIERIGAPVHQGDMLFKLAKVDRLYAELEISERDIHEIQDSLEGEIALTSRPGQIFRIEVFRMEPAAVPKEKGNVFIVHANFSDNPAAWWRPGMTGVAKLHMGKRKILWILTHRTVDFLRLRLWL